MIMGVGDRKGTLEKGKDADVLIFDDDITSGLPLSVVKSFMFRKFLTSITKP